MTTPRGERRRAALLSAVVEDVSRHGLVDFSLRRAAKAAGTSHKVLLYHFSGADQLLREALQELRAARLARTDAQAWADPTASLGERVHAAFTTLVEEDAPLRVLDQATGLALYDPARYTHLGTDATDQYLPVILELLPTDWSEEHRRALSTLILATLRGLLADLLTSGDNLRITAGLTVLERMLDTEERRQAEHNANPPRR
jgi:AcrR family transcriptional regulator